MKKRRRRQNSNPEKEIEELAETNVEEQGHSRKSLRGVERLNGMASTQKYFDKNTLTLVLTKFWTMSDAELILADKDPYTTQSERAIIKQISISRNNKNLGHANSAYSDMMDRLGGKAKQSLELSGPEGAAIEVKMTPVEEIRKAIAGMPREKILEIREANKSIAEALKKSNES